MLLTEPVSEPAAAELPAQDDPELYPVESLSGAQDEPQIPEVAVTSGADDTDGPSDLSDEWITSAGEPDNYVSDYRTRVLVVDALRNMKYPAPAHKISQHCIKTSEQRNIDLSNRRLGQLLSSAHEMGLLQEASSTSDEGQEFTFVENAQQIKLFLENEM
jgi:hypothetical protein